MLWGRTAAVAAWWMLLLASLLCALGVAQRLDVHLELGAGYTALLVVCGLMAARFRRQAASGGGKQIETLTFVWTLSLYLGLGLVPLIMRGTH